MVTPDADRVTVNVLSETTPSLVPTPEPPLDLTHCEREPIHIPGTIQSHGALLAVRESDLIITQASTTTERVLGSAAEGLLGQPLAHVLGPGDLALLRLSLAGQEIEAHPLHVLTTGADGGGEHPLDVIVHRFDAALLLEFEPAHTDPRVTPLTIYHQVTSAGDALERAPTVQAFCQEAAERVRELTGFDRVMVYQFMADAHGVVVAEARRPDLDPYLGLHYPASDIPAQARALYLRNRLRLIADVASPPSPVIPAINPLTGSPLDMSYAVLRSVSPVHIQYLMNMGVAASMSISLVRDGRLWGLISCHHTTPRHVPFDVRAACAFLGHLAASKLGEKELAETRAEREHLRHVGRWLAERVDRDPTGRFDAALLAPEQVTATPEREGYPHLTAAAPGFDVLSFIPAGGAAVCAEGAIHLLGATPGPRAVRHLLDWLALNVAGEVYATASLPRVYRPARRFKAMASGLLAVAVSREQRSYVVWFRSEVIQTVEWGGDPTKPAEISAVTARADDPPLTPRASFASWKQTVRLTADPWRPWQIEAAEELGRALRVVALRRAVEGLTRLNAELDAFAHMVSHDLKEPLRGLRHSARFLAEDYTRLLDADGVARLATLTRLAERLEHQIDALLRYSRVGRGELPREDVDLDAVVAEQVDLLSHQLREAGIEVRILGPLPQVRANRTGVSEVMHNLLTNAIKYNDKPERWIEIGARPARGGPSPALPPPRRVPAARRGGGNAESRAPTVLYVRDNGIGIAAEHREAIFQLFRRLHERDAYGGGTGVGLAIARKIVERHGGRLWFDSMPGEGTTFYVLLSGESRDAGVRD